MKDRSGAEAFFLDEKPVIIDRDINIAVLFLHVGQATDMNRASKGNGKDYKRKKS
jgi:hypothetical protein